MDIFALVVFGLIGLYGLLVWRIAWTGKCPEYGRRPIGAGGIGPRSA
jgi:hypothetical protein